MILSTISIVLMVTVLFFAIKWGKQNETLTNVTIVVSALASIISIILCFAHWWSVLDFVFSVFALIFALLLKRIVNFFEADYIKRSTPDPEFREKMYHFDQETLQGEEDFWDEEKRFGGNFTDYNDLNK